MSVHMSRQGESFCCQWKRSITPATNFIELICCLVWFPGSAAEVNEKMQKTHKLVHPVCTACAAPKSLVGKRRGKKSV